MNTDMGSDKKQIRSHIQIPYSVLKLFEKDYSNLWVYDINKRIIKRGHARSLNTSAGYFDEATEEWLSKYVESQYSCLVHKINSQLQGQEKLDTIILDIQSSEIQEIVLRYVCSLIMRTPDLVADLNKSPEVEKLIRNKNVVDGIPTIIELGIFDGYYTTLVTNNTKKPFVISMAGMANMIKPSLGHFFLVSATPYFSFLMVESSKEVHINQSCGKELVSLYEINDDIIDNVNMCFLRQQCKRKYGFVASGDRMLLECLIKAQ